jgi:hypothetical protein
MRSKRASKQSLNLLINRGSPGTSCPFAICPQPCQNAFREAMRERLRLISIIATSHTRSTLNSCVKITGA